MKRLLLAQIVNGAVELTGSGAAVVLGIDMATLAERCHGRSEASALPERLQRLGRRRARAAQAATGNPGAMAVLAYWATQRWGSAIEFDHDEPAGSLWLLTDDPEVARAVAGTASE